MPDAPKVRPPDTDEPSELRDKLNELDIAPPTVNKRNLAHEKGKRRTDFHRHEAFIRTLNEDVSTLKRRIPRDAMPEVERLKSDVAALPTQDKLRGEVVRLDARLTETKKVLEADVAALPTQDKLRTEINRLKGHLVETRQTLVDALEARPLLSTVRSECRRETARVESKRAVLETEKELMAAAIGGNVHFYCAREAHSESVGGMAGDGSDFIDFDVLVVKENVARKVFTATNATNKINCTAHGLVNGRKLTGLKNKGGALPTGLSDQIYYAMSVTANDFQVTTDKPGTASPTAATFSDDGTGTHKFVYVTSAPLHEWMDLELVVSIADTIVAYNLVYDAFAPESEDLRWREDEAEVPRINCGYGRLRLYLPSAPLATETATITVKIASDDKLMAKTVASMDLVTTFVA